MEAKMVLGVQIVGVIFGLGMAYLTFLYHKREEYTFNEALFWFTIWLGFIFISLFPDVLYFVQKSLRIVRIFDVLVIGGFMFLMAVNFYLYSVTKKNQKSLEKIVRKVALHKK